MESYDNDIYFASRDEIERLDKLAMEKGLQIRQMMELAGYHMTGIFKQKSISKIAKIAVACGKGNKAGDGLSATRHLVNNGWTNISVILLSSNMKEDPLHHLALLEKMDIDIIRLEEGKEYIEKAITAIQTADVIIDALIGYSLNGAPRGNYEKIIQRVNSSSAKTIAYDIPSGLTATDGNIPGECVKAETTLTLALPKKAFKTENGREYSGEIFLGDIGIPEFIYNLVSQNSRPDFKNGIVKLS